jgi:excisionase family DNA binding protein
MTTDVTVTLHLTLDELVAVGQFLEERRRLAAPTVTRREPVNGRRRRTQPTKAEQPGEPMAVTAPRDELVPIDRVAKVLKLHPATVRNMYRRGTFPRPVKTGARKIRFSRQELDAWYAERLGGQGDPFFPLIADDETSHRKKTDGRVINEKA